MTWRNDAACLGVDPELFFPERGASIAEAKAVCAGCPVRGPCLEHALATGEKEGVYGGTSARERRTIRRQRGLQRPRTEIGQRVRLMASHGLNAPAIAERLGVTTSIVYKHLKVSPGVYTSQAGVGQ